jgi:hypothetical protein
MRRFTVTPAIDVSLHDVARAINIVAINTGAMFFVLTDDVKAAKRGAIPFATTGYARRRGSMFSVVKVGFLRPQAHDD